MLYNLSMQLPLNATYNIRMTKFLYCPQKSLVKICAVKRKKLILMYRVYDLNLLA